MKRKTTISKDLQHITKMIDPRSGKVLREGTTPMATVGAFKANAVPMEEDKTEERLDKMEQGIEEIKKLLTNK